MPSLLPLLELGLSLLLPPLLLLSAPSVAFNFSMYLRTAAIAPPPPSPPPPPPPPPPPSPPPPRSVLSYCHFLLQILHRPIPLSDISLATAARVFGCCLLYLCLRCHCCPLCIACDAASDQGVPLTSHARVAYHHLPAGAARPGALRPWRLGGRWAASLRFRTALVSTHLVRPLGR